MTKLTKRSAGRRGGLATLARHGRQHMQAIGRRGAQVFWRRYHLVPCDLADFAIVERETGKVINLLYQSGRLKAALTQKQTAMSKQTHGGLAEGTSNSDERKSRNES